MVQLADRHSDWSTELYHTYTYTGVNPLVQSLTRPNGSVTSYQYDLLNRLTEIANKTSTNEILNQHVFTYNTWDMRGSETISGSAVPPMPSLPEGTKDYDYNAVNQLLGAINPNQLFDYDADENMTQGYTPEGCVFTAEYDAEDRMTWLEYTDGTSVVHKTVYRYSGDGFLAEIQKYENSTLVDTVRIVRDGFLAVQERDGSNNVLKEYTWGLNLGGGIGGLLNLKQGGQDYSYLYDGKGNVAAVLDGTQAVVAAYRHAPFGKLLAKTGSLTQPFGFSTKRYDPQTGLIEYGLRRYAPAIGRWTTRDPLGEAGGMNLYAFVGNNPVNWVDPHGEEVLTATTLGLIALASAAGIIAVSPPGQEALTGLGEFGVEAVRDFPSNVANVAGQVADAAAHTAAAAGDLIDKVLPPCKISLPPGHQGPIDNTPGTKAIPKVTTPYIPRLVPGVPPPPPPILLT